MPPIGHCFLFNYRFLLSAALILFVAVPAFVKSDGLAPGGAATVVEIVDDDKLRLDDGELLQLISLQASKVPLRLINFKIWLLINEPKDAFARRALGKRLHLGFGSRKQDRHGRVLAHLHAEDGTLIAGEI